MGLVMRQRSIARLAKAVEGWEEKAGTAFDHTSTDITDSSVELGEISQQRHDLRSCVVSKQDLNKILSIQESLQASIFNYTLATKIHRRYETKSSVAMAECG